MRCVVPSVCVILYRVSGVELFANNTSMSPETKRSIPPPTETIQTKPFPVRGETRICNSLAT
jgi:hypothetical protein